MRQYLAGYNELHHDEIRARKNQRRREIKNGAPLLRPSHPRIDPKDPRDCLRCGIDYMPTAPNQKFCARCGPEAFAELARTNAKLFRLNNLDRVKEQAREWRRKHRDDVAYKARKRLRTQAYNSEVRLRVLSYYGGGRLACVCCGETEMDFLTIDHVKNDGAKERKTLGRRSIGGIWFYKRLLKAGLPSGYQTYCFNCNCSKGKHDECIHKKKVFIPDRSSTILDRWIYADVVRRVDAVSASILPMNSSTGNPRMRNDSSQSLLSEAGEPRIQSQFHVLG